MNYLEPKVGKRFIDATIGGGGHTKELLGQGASVLGIDFDPVSIEFVKKTIKSKHLKLVCGNFADIKNIAVAANFNKVNGILFDLGVSSHQLESAERGFSFQRNASLDMRMNPKLAVTAADLVNGLNEGELNELLTKYGQESSSRRIGAALVRARIKKKIETTQELVEIIQGIVPRRGKLHPATKTFLALRIAVNDELNNLRKGLEDSLALLKRKGRILVISFHSLEDKIVKEFFKEKKKSGVLKILTKKPIVPSLEEISLNSRSRSAKLRVGELIH